MASEQESPKAPREFPGWFYRAILLAATIIWGGNFVIAKLAMVEVSASWIVGIRFLLGGLILLAIFARRFSKVATKQLLLAGTIIGVFSFLGYWTQFLGLSGTTPAKNAFLSTCYYVVVPFICWIAYKRRPTKMSLLAAAICLAGMGTLVLQGDMSINWGDGVSILSAVLYGMEIVAISHFIKDYDVIAISIVQMIVSGALGCLLGVFQGVPDASQIFNTSFLLEIGYITLLGSCFASTAQNFGQTHVPASQASVMFALESVFGTIFSVIFYKEVLTVRMIIGFALILLAVLVSQLGDRGRKAIEEGGEG